MDTSAARLQTNKKANRRFDKKRISRERLKGTESLQILDLIDRVLCWDFCHLHQSSCRFPAQVGDWYLVNASRLQRHLYCASISATICFSYIYFQYPIIFCSRVLDHYFFFLLLITSKTFCLHTLPISFRYVDLSYNRFKSLMSLYQN